MCYAAHCIDAFPILSRKHEQKQCRNPSSGRHKCKCSIPKHRFFYSTHYRLYILPCLMSCCCCFVKRQRKKRLLGYYVRQTFRMQVGGPSFQPCCVCIFTSLYIRLVVVSSRLSLRIRHQLLLVKWEASRG